MTTLTQADRNEFACAYMLDQMIGAEKLSEAELIEEAEMTPASPENVVATHEVYADFVKAHGEPTKSWMRGSRQMHVWRRVQMQFGRARGDLYLMEFDGVSGSIFTGQ